MKDYTKDRSTPLPIAALLNDIQRVVAKPRETDLVCVNGHDRCYLGPDPKCPYCERR